MRTKLRLAISFFFLLLILTACQKEFTIEDGNTTGTNTGTAVYAFTGAPGSCVSPVVNGIYTVGTAVTAANSITVQVNVDTIGTYSITTGSANGISFSANGSFLTAGLQTITLNASGTPAAAGAYTFTIGTAGCVFSVAFTGTIITSSNCKDCIYIPVCVGSKYTYYDTSIGVASVRIADILNSVDTIIGSKVFQKLSFTNSLTGYLNCTNGETTAVGYQLVSGSGNVLKYYRSIMLKANAALGDTWSDTLLNPAGQTVVQNFTIKSKVISKTLNGLNFADVIVVSLEVGLDIPGIGYIPAAITDYSYARGVGLVETATLDYNTGQQFYHSVIKSYFIP